MQWLIFFIVIFTSLAVSAQVEVTNPNPDVFLDSRKYLYLDAENPVIITTGGLKSVKVTMINGTIKKTDVPGKYLATPDENSFFSTIILTAKKYREEFHFDHKELPRPKAVLAGLRNEDGVVLFFKSTAGVMALIENFPIQVSFKVDSFQITIWDSLSEKTHMNIGAKWDETTKQMINTLRQGMYVNITNVHVSGLRRKYILEQNITHFLR